MKPNNTLGIIVNSNRYFNYVTHLADAAVQEQKIVRMHLLGPGWAYIQTTAFNRLRKVVQISLCALSARQYASRQVELSNQGITVVQPGKLSKILKECHRYVVL